MESAIQKRQPMKIDIGAVFNFSVSLACTRAAMRLADWAAVGLGEVCSGSTSQSPASTTRKSCLS